MAQPDLAQFAEKDFDAKAFINAACRGKTGDEPLERSLAELEMRLHLSAEDVSLYLADNSARAQHRIPAAARELLHIQDDVAALRGSAAGALAQVEDAGSGGTAAVIGQLEALDRVKRRMEEACSTLKEAAGLSALFQRVDDHFASNDLPRVAEALAGMRRGLAVVGDSVAEFRGGRDRLARLEERFAGMVEAPLIATFTKQKAEDVRQLSGMLETAGRGDAVQRLYCAARLPPLQAVWDSHGPGAPFATWLPGFYEQVGRALQCEAAWCGGALPERCPALPLALLNALLGRIEKPFKQRLSVAMAAQPGSVLPLEHLEQAAAAAADFVAAAFAALGGGGAGGVTADEFGEAQARVLAPLEEALGQYADRELACLSTELQAVAAQGTAAVGGDAGAAALEGCIAPALAACDAALARCLRLTAGTALPALARALDRAVQQYVAALQAGVASLQGRLAEAGGDGGPSDPDAAAESAEAVLPLLAVASQLVQRVALLEASLRQAAAEAVPQLLDGSGGAGGSLPSPAALRLRAQPALRQQLATFASSAASGAALLPLAASAATDLEASVSACVLEVLSQRPHATLAPLPRLSEWQQRVGALPLPTFSAYPLQYVTSVGEYLMMLPQQLEGALVGEENSEEAGQLVADWIDKVALDAAACYQQQLAALPGLSAQGAAQLAADLEYFCNVLSTLGVAVPPSLAAWQAAAAAPPDGMPAVAEAAAEGGDVGARSAVAAVARLRGVQLGGGAQA